MSSVVVGVCLSFWEAVSEDEEEEEEEEREKGQDERECGESITGDEEEELPDPNTDAKGDP